MQKYCYQIALLCEYCTINTVNVLFFEFIVIYDIIYTESQNCE